MAGLLKQEFPPLLPLGFHAVNLSQLRQLCVTNFPRSSTRSEIMDGLERVVHEVNKTQLRLDIWVNGSFLTQKLDPDDSDVAIRFFGAEVERATPEQIAILQWAAETDLKPTHRCDCYAFPEFPEGHDLYDLGQWRRAYWLRQFGFSRADDPKGLAVIRLPLGVA